MKPNILNPEWKYTPAIETDIRRTFARIRAERGLCRAPTRGVVVAYRPQPTTKDAAPIRTTH